MKYLTNIKSFEDLKKKFRELAMQLHPDMGGSDAAMQELNNEYDVLFPVWKSRTAPQSKETAESTRREFYTRNGWAGKNYKCGRNTKDIANIIRTWLKEEYSDCKFSVFCSSASMCSSLYVYLMEAPYDVFSENASGYERECGHIDINQYWFDRENRLVPRAKEMMREVLEVIKSYHMDDSDAMIDYFDTNFYLTFGVGKWDKPFKVVARQKKLSDGCTYETYTTKEKKKRKVLKAVPVDSIPDVITEGMYLRPQAYFTGQIHKGGVYKVMNVDDGSVRAYWTGRKMKNVCTGHTPGNLFWTTADRLKKYLAKGSVEIVKFVEDWEEYEVEVTKKRKVANNKVANV